jgi:predicted nucleic acid-binding protein
MKTYFLDTSALLKRYLKETGSDVVDTVFDGDGARYVTGVCLLECFSTFQRLHLVDGLVTREHLQQLHAAVALDVAYGRVVVLAATPADIDASAQVLARRYLTAVDALQIATATALGLEVVFVSSDAKLNRVAAEHGLAVLDPNAAP